MTSALPGKVESPCRKGIAPLQYVGANPYRRSRATSPGFALALSIAQPCQKINKSVELNYCKSRHRRVDRPFD
jgi:hypothetical protein